MPIACLNARGNEIKTVLLISHHFRALKMGEIGVGDINMYTQTGMSNIILYLTTKLQTS